MHAILICWCISHIFELLSHFQRQYYLSLCCDFGLCSVHDMNKCFTFPVSTSKQTAILMTNNMCLFLIECTFSEGLNTLRHELLCTDSSVCIARACPSKTNLCTFVNHLVWIPVLQHRQLWEWVADPNLWHETSASQHDLWQILRPVPGVDADPHRTSTCSLQPWGTAVLYAEFGTMSVTRKQKVF